MGRLAGHLFGCAVLAVAASAIAATPAAASSTDWLGLRTLNIAHQGGEDEAPSNTMYAYERALRLGSDMLEVDIHTTADGELVVLHDATVDRTTDGTGRVYDMTLEQVQALDAGHDMVPGEGTEAGRPASDYPYRGVRTGERRAPRGFSPDDFRIPTLAEVMAAYPDVPINIEIKGAADTDLESFRRNAEALAEFLNRLGRTEGIIVASFNDAALTRFHERAPQIDLAPGIAGVAGYKLAGTPPPDGTVAFQVPIEFGGVTVTDEPFVQRAHSDGYAVHVWTINDPGEMNMLLDWGVDGIMTAEPIRLERVLCERDIPRPPRPPSVPGEHCEEKASIACDVEPARVKRKGDEIAVTLRRRDGFDARCAGTATVKAGGKRAKLPFDFGESPPPEGPAKEVAAEELSEGGRRALAEGAEARVSARPYLAFAERRELRIR